MEYNTEKSIEVLERTPSVLSAMLSGISPEWYLQNEGGDSWSPYDIVGHLIHGEKTDWIPRMNVILYQPGEKTFQPFDRFAQFEESKGKTLLDLLLDFDLLRKKNLTVLKSKILESEDFQKTGIHPNFGKVTLKQLLSSWVVHDLDHVAQISRVMAKQYEHEVGPWRQFLRILSSS